MRAPRLPLMALAVALLLSTPAAAQTAPSIDARTWRPSSDPEASLASEPVVTPGGWRWNGSAWLAYGRDPIVLSGVLDGGASGKAHVVRDQGTADVVAGLGLGERAAIGVDVPVFVEGGDGSLAPAVVKDGKVSSVGIGDIAITGKATVVSNDRMGVRGGFGLAAVAALSLPTGDRASFLGDGSTRTSLRLLAEYAVGVGAVRASLGYALRTEWHTWPDASGGARFGDAIPWSLALVLRPKAAFGSLDPDDRQVWEIAAYGAVPAGPVAPFGIGDPGASTLSPAVAAIDDRIALGHYRDTYVLAGVQVGLDTATGVPTIGGVLSLGWAPRSHDRDGDGVPDDVDECPDLAEDRDGIQDGDGCPEDDADGDGILDAQDACPLVPGVWWNDPKKNGCPAPDSDGDGVPDPLDACPAVKGVPSDDPKTNGCPAPPAPPPPPEGATAAPPPASTAPAPVTPVTPAAPAASAPPSAAPLSPSGAPPGGGAKP